MEYLKFTARQNATVTSVLIILLMIQNGLTVDLQHGPIGPGRCGTGLYADPHIAGGVRTKLKNYPWTALLVYRYGDRGTEDFFECGGSLISERYVLTAAHCVDKLNESYTLDRVRLGEWDIVAKQDCDEWICNDSPKDVGIEGIVKHDKFSRNTYQNDIALIKLKENVTFTGTVSPVCLPNSEKLKAFSTDKGYFTVIGWGATEHRNETQHFKSRYKIEVQLPGVHTMSCQKEHKRMISKTQLCAGGDLGKDTCQGDSGGGLIARRFGYYFVYGIVSNGHEICELGIPGVYTRVTSFLDWIKRNTD